MPKLYATLMNNNFIYSVLEERPCFICGLLTRYIDMNFEAPLHLGCKYAADRQVALNICADSDGVAVTP